MNIIRNVIKQKPFIMLLFTLLLSLAMARGSSAQSNDGTVHLPIIQNDPATSSSTVEPATAPVMEEVVPADTVNIVRLPIIQNGPATSSSTTEPVTAPVIEEIAPATTVNIVSAASLPNCTRTITADVVALDQPFYYNRLGAINANGMIYALRRDVVDQDDAPNDGVLTPGQVSLRPDKRPRPIVLRMNEGDCLNINFTNLLDPVEFFFNLPNEFPTGEILGLGVPIDPKIDDQPLTRVASIHIDGLYLYGDIGSDGSNVGQNTPSSLVPPGGSTTYIYRADHEATHLLYSMGATMGADGAGGSRTYGLFGAVNVQKEGAEWYRSQLTREEMDWATPPEAFTDTNESGFWDDAVPADTFTEVNGTSGWQPADILLTDENGNGVWDDAVLADEYVESNGTAGWQLGEALTVDWNGNNSWDDAVPADTFTEVNGIPGWQPADILLTDENGNGVWDDAIPAEPLTDINGDGVFNAHRTTPDGQPVLNYDAVYPPAAGTAKVGIPIINMLDGSVLVHSDINAIITGPNRENFVGTYTDNLASENRNAPYREFTVIFHDDVFAVQAFPGFFNDPVLGHTLAGVSDSFPINYGSGGIGSEIVANRLGVGPMWDCAECKYEEFFLTSFTVGDPAMIVDIPANFDLDGDGVIDPGTKATKALFPDDPSNVHHSYLSDRVKFRNLHAGPKEHHIFHLHAHQWLFNPDDPQSNYLDGQALGPGSGYTYEIAYGGSGNRNKTAGDSIFHCHFYPHFAQGMWEMWRVHDTFEQGTLMDDQPDGHPIPAPGSRALPDGEIVAGTPIPGLVPIPTNPMAPMPDADATIVASDLNDDGTDDSSQFDANGDGLADIFQIVDADDDGVGDPLVNLDVNPGYPWFTPGLMGHRPPTPAFDMDPDMNGDSTGFDGGLPRHVISSGPDEDNLDHAGAPIEMYVSRLDFNKILHEASAIQIPEGGTAAEKVAMDYHAGLADNDGNAFYDSYLPNGVPATGIAGFEVNGLPPVAGAPYADPCRADGGGTLPNLPVSNGTTVPNRTIKGANIEMPVILNKVGWHFQQQRFEALWEDVVDTLTNARAPQPMIMRLNSTDCAEFHHTNLVPNVYQLDDYQVRTPTDIIGQHIHLVKFDVMSADGSANGWNYEDGTLSPDEVRERIEAFNNGGGLVTTAIDPMTSEPVVDTALAPEAHPFFGGKNPDPTKQNWLGARTTIQRWYADPLLERSWDGGVGTVFTHDHYGPSTHQQVGLYSTLLVEPEGSVWRHNETGAELGTRGDGGPTTWQAIIEPGPGGVEFDAHREFYFEFADFQHAYEAGTGAEITQPNENLLGDPVSIPSYADFAGAINPSFRLPPANPEDIYVHPNYCPGTFLPNGNPNPLGPILRPCPEAISADDPGTYALNFRNEPIGLRVFDGVVGADGAGGIDGGQTPGLAGDLAFAYQSRTDRAIPELNVQPETNGISPYPPLTADVQPGDPWTPILRVYMGDQVRIRVQVGAHEEEHNFTIPGLKWKKEPNSPNSGWRNSEFFGIDEYFNLDVPIVPDTQKSGGSVDYIYTVGAELEGMWNGVWGILRSYTSERNDLYELPSNDVARGGYDFTNQAEFNGICPVTAPVKTFDVTAVRAIDVLDPNQGLVYNDRLTTLRALPGGITGQGPLIDPTVLMYVLDDELTYDPATGTPNGLRPGAPVEPLILRVNAGDCVLVNLTNDLPDDLSGTEMPGWNSLVPIVQKDENIAQPGVGGILTFNANDITPSSYVGLTPQLLAFDPKTNGGFSTGLTTGKLVAPGSTDTYRWYAGDVTVTNNGIRKNKTQFTLAASPVEFGAAGLMPADRIKGTENGLVGAIIVEPENSCWIADPGTRAQATVWKGAKDAVGAGLIGACAGTPVGSTDSFRDFVTIMQNDVNLRYGGTVDVLNAAGGVVETINCGESVEMRRMECAVPNIAAEGPLGPTEESQDSGQKAINYGADPLWFRLGVVPDFFQIIHREADLKDLIPNVYSNFLNIGDGLGEAGEPQTVVYRASLNGPQYGRMRVLMPGGHARGVTYTLHGHEWQSQPYINDSSEIGDNPISEYYGAQEGINPTGHWDFVVDLGGPFNVVGDYLMRDQASFGSFQGLWGLLRFNETAPVTVDVASSTPKYLCDATGANCTAGIVDINLKAQAFDLDGDVATVTFTQPSFGTVSDPENDGTVTFTYPLGTVWPCADPFACSTTFTYTVIDGQGLESNTGTVTITVTNTAPIANNDTIMIKAPAVNGAVDVLLNDLDAEGDLDLDRFPLVELIGQPVDRDGVQVGTIADASIGADGRTLTYTTSDGFTGVVVISYQVTDESGAVSNVALVRMAVNVDDITITQARYQPNNLRWSISGTCNTPFLPDGVTPTEITIFSGPTIEGGPPVIGTAQCVTGDPVGTWSFSGPSDGPAPNPEVFNFVSAESALQGFYEGHPVTFAGQNNAPVAVDDAYPTDDGTLNVAALGVLANDQDADFDPLSAVLVSDVSHGTLVLNADGSFTYAAGPTYEGTDSFTYRADDGQDLSALPATVRISGNVPPVAVDNDYSTAQNVDLIVAARGVLVNDTDTDGGPNALTVSAVNGTPIDDLTFPIALASGATLTLNADGSFTYKPPTNVITRDSFTYVANDGLADSNEATVTIVVGNPNLPPVAVDDSYATEQNTALTELVPGVLFNDTDANGTQLTVSAVNGAPANVGNEITLDSGATLTLSGDGSFTYTPVFNFVGTDSFTYATSDGTVDSNTATVTITVEDVVTVTSATYRTRQGRWQIQGTVSNVTSSVDVYRCAGGDCTSPQLIEAANVDPISGAWDVNTTTGPPASPGDKVFAVSNFGGLSDPPVDVTVRR